METTMTPYNFRRAIGYSVLVLLVILLLVGCASKFDSQEHAMIVNIHVISQDDGVCSSRDSAYLAAQTMYQDARWAWNYGRYLQKNGEMTRMTENLMAITKELDDRYKKTDTAVSAVYCRAKFKTIHQATESILRVSARRER
jgi:hypothetical protein